MAFRHGKNASFKLGTAGTPATLVDLSSYCDEIGFPRKSDTAETTTFQAGGKTYLVGFSDNQITLKGKFDSAADAQFAALVGFDSSAINFEFGPEGTTTGRIKYTGACYVSEYSSTTPVNDVVTFSATLMINGAVTRGTF